jgi:hypothetical protein
MPEGKPVPEEMKELVAQLLAREEQIRQQTTSFLEEVERRVVGQAYRTASQRFDPRNDGGQDLIAAAVAVSESGQRSQGGGDQPPSQMDQAIGLAPEN